MIGVISNSVGTAVSGALQKAIESHLNSPLMSEADIGIPTMESQAANIRRFRREIAREEKADNTLLYVAVGMLGIGAGFGIMRALLK